MEYDYMFACASIVINLMEVIMLNKFEIFYVSYLTIYDQISYDI